MPNYGNFYQGNNVEIDSRQNHESAFPNLFPNTLEQMCNNCILSHLIRCGKQVEKKSKRIVCAETDTSSSLQRMNDNSAHLQLQQYSATNSNYNSGHHSITISHLPIRTRQPTTLPSHTTIVPIPSDCNAYSSSFFFTKTNYFVDSVDVTRYFLTSFLASSLLDQLTDAARREGNAARDGHLFCFSVLCNERLARLVGCQHKSRGT